MSVTVDQQRFLCCSDVQKRSEQMASMVFLRFTFTPKLSPGWALIPNPYCVWKIEVAHSSSTKLTRHMKSNYMATRLVGWSCRSDASFPAQPSPVQRSADAPCPLWTKAQHGQKGSTTSAVVISSFSGQAHLNQSKQLGTNLQSAAVAKSVPKQKKTTNAKWH